MKEKYKKIFVKINCDILGWHSPNENIYITMPYGITQKSKCKYCGRDIEQDGQGNWYLERNYQMKDIKKVRQALNEIKGIEIRGKGENDNWESLYETNEVYKNRINALYQFITDVEELIKENEELKQLESIAYKIVKKVQLGGKQDLELKDVIELLEDLETEIEQSKSLHNSQSIEPSVLEKIDKLENRNKELATDSVNCILIEERGKDNETKYYITLPKYEIVDCKKVGLSKYKIFSESGTKTTCYCMSFGTLKEAQKYLDSKIKEDRKELSK